MDRQPEAEAAPVQRAVKISPVPTRPMARRWRGEPIVMLVLLLAAWAGLRSALWENPFAMSQSPVEWLVPELGLIGGLGADTFTGWRSAANEARSGVTQGAAENPQTNPDRILAFAPFRSATFPPATQPVALDDVGMGGGAMVLGIWPAAPYQAQPTRSPAKPPAKPPVTPPTRPQQDLMAAAAPKRDVWTGDAWLFLRPDATNRAEASGGLATYGASQAGAVLRYHIAQESPLAPTAYLRASSSLAAAEQAELALGISARPARRLPVTLHTEMRIAEIGNGSELRPAVFAVAAPPVARLPARTEARFYGQAGYVAGSFATSFVDGQARIDREVARFDAEAGPASSARPLRLRAGAGVWGGAQRGAARADFGPTATAQFNIGQLPVTAAMDYRFRIAGEAQPASGAALTLATNF